MASHCCSNSRGRSRSCEGVEEIVGNRGHRFLPLVVGPPPGNLVGDVLVALSGEGITVEWTYPPDIEGSVLAGKPPGTLPVR